MGNIFFNKPSDGRVDSTEVALDVRNKGIGGCLNCISPDTGMGLRAEGGIGIMGITKSKFGSGVFGEVQHPEGGTGVTGRSKNWIGVYGESEKSTGVFGKSKDWIGVYGESEKSTGIFGKGIGGVGVYGESEKSTGIFGKSKDWIGVYGESEKSTGIFGKSKDWIGVYGASDTMIGVWGRAPMTGVAGFFEGNVEVTGDIRLLNADCAEDFEIIDKNVEAGTVMVITEKGSLQPSFKEYDKKVAGIVSGANGYKPAIVLDRQSQKVNEQPSDIDRLPLALMGKVYCKVDATHSSIEIGDLLTTSSTKGHAMKADDPNKSFGSVIGKALGSVDKGLGMIPVLVSLQ